MSTNKEEAWGSRVGLILAMAGNAVGLGNFLRFPVKAIENGGGAFIIPYLVCFLLMGIPLLWIEWSLGRFGGRSGNHSTPFILDTMGKNSFWKYFGVFGIFTNIGVAAFYTYIESWTLVYVFYSITQHFSGMDYTQVAMVFDQYTNTYTTIPSFSILVYILCLALNVYILSQGLSGGIEKVAKVGMPILILFGIFLAINGITLGNANPTHPEYTSYDALDYLWTPQYDSLLNFKVWLEAAGQIFFTLSVGMGTIQCYASYLRSKDDIALNAMSAGWMNGFVEIVLGASVVIPIAVGFFGLEWVQDNGGFALAFQALPSLFGQWGFLGIIAGVMWFGLLFFAGITSSLAMGTPWMGFMQDEFQWSRKKSAWTFGLVTLLMGLPTVVFYSQGVFDEYDYWAGTVALVVFALAEVILFAWIFGMTKGWEEINAGADIKISIIFKYIIRFVTPPMLIIIFIASLIQPKDNNWGSLFDGTFELDNGSIIGKIMNKGIQANRSYFASTYENDIEGKGEVVEVKGNIIRVVIEKDTSNIEPANYGTVDKILVKKGDKIQFKDKVAEGSFTNKIFYLFIGRMLLVLLFVFLAVLVYFATIRRKRMSLK